MQTLFRNPLADPFVLGISSGASLGVALVVMAAGGLKWSLLLEQAGIAGNLSLVLAATLGALGVLSIVLGVARRVESNLTLLIVGLMFGYITGSIVQVLMQFTVEHQMQSYITWTFGSFGSVTWQQMGVFAPTVACGLGLAWVLAKPLNALLLGDGYARSMGVNVRLVRSWIIGGAAVLAGTITAYCGPIGFLGIAVPHLGRVLLKTSDHRKLIPAVVMLGATLALLADLISQAPGTQIALPLNAVTALIGAPVVVGVILRRRQIMEAGYDRRARFLRRKDSPSATGATSTRSASSPGNRCRPSAGPVRLPSRAQRRRESRPSFARSPGCRRRLPGRSSLREIPCMRFRRVRLQNG